MVFLKQLFLHFIFNSCKDHYNLLLSGKLQAIFRDPRPFTVDSPSSIIHPWAKSSRNPPSYLDPAGDVQTQKYNYTKIPATQFQEIKSQQTQLQKKKKTQQTQIWEIYELGALKYV